MPSFDVMLDGGASAYEADELPEVGDVIDVGVQARVEEIDTGEAGKPLIIARRLNES